MRYYLKETNGFPLEGKGAKQNVVKCMVFCKTFYNIFFWNISLLINQLTTD